MSSSFDVFKLTDDDAMKFLVSESHIGTKKASTSINIRKTYEKLLFAARSIAAIENPSDVVVVVSAIATPKPIQQHQPMPTQQRFVAFFEKERGVDIHTSIKRRKNYINPALYQALRNAYGIDEKGTCFCAVYDPNAFAADDFYDALGFQSDPQLDHQTVRGASNVNTPVIAMANTDSPLEFVDIVIPANSKTYIHPFFDGNGRCCRFLSNFVLARKGFNPVLFDKDMRKEYNAALSYANKTGGPGARTLDLSRFTNLYAHLIQNAEFF
ncbi:hypothetical protein niasHT_016511 [Heterodera trifolii]|uniref:Fido domain-containing protein n=1 Tax=Heterodera trifolii TaxID=157864 RepID=A0ABD2L468_9BILA